MNATRTPPAVFGPNGTPPYIANADGKDANGDGHRTVAWAALDTVRIDSQPPVANTMLSSLHATSANATSASGFGTSAICDGPVALSVRTWALRNVTKTRSPFATRRGLPC